MINYTIGTSSEYADLLDFGNYVFKIDFKELLPKLYDGREDLAPYHFIGKENDRIKAMVGCFPLTLQTGDQLLKGMGIGTVSVHPYSRGQGHMKQLMKNAMSFIETEQADFAILSGQRQRYEYFGFTPTGSLIHLVVDKVNLKHKGITHSTTDTLKSFDTLSQDDLQQISNWHHAKPLHSIRPLKDFVAICKSWEAKPYALYNDGILKGYMILAGSNILDFYIEDTSLLGSFLSLILNKLDLDGVNLSIGLHDQENLKYLMSFAENYRIATATQLKIVNYQNFILAFLELKASYEPLEKGKLILEIKDQIILSIEVSDTIQVSPTTHTPDISLSHLEATHFICDPVSFIPQELRSFSHIIHSWFPLPFSYCHTDNV